MVSKEVWISRLAQQGLGSTSLAKIVVLETSNMIVKSHLISDLMKSGKRCINSPDHSSPNAD
jgi:hypothetical protein